MAASGSSGGGLPPRPAVGATRRRTFVAPHRQGASNPLNGAGSREGTSTGGSSGRMPAPGSGSSCLPRRLPSDQPPLGPRVLTFTEPHSQSNSTTSTTEIYEVAGDELSPNQWTPDYSVPNHWTPDYSQPRSSSSQYFTDMMTQEGADDFELLRQPDPTPSTGGKASSKRGSNYTDLEDLQLCKSWIHISNDPVIGNDQAAKTYWQRIANDFHINRDFDSDRNANSLEHRFATILKECMKFQGYYEEVERRHPSGVPYQEHILEAQARYARQAKGKNCQFEQCWLTLRHTQKFQATLEGNKRPTKSRDLNLPAGSEQDTQSSAQGQESSGPAAKITRPPGRKKSKEKLKRNEGDDDYKNMMQTLFLLEPSRRPAMMMRSSSDSSSSSHRRRSLIRNMDTCHSNKKRAIMM